MRNEYGDHAGELFRGIIGGTIPGCQKSSMRQLQAVISNLGGEEELK